MRKKALKIAAGLAVLLLLVLAAAEVSVRWISRGRLYDSCRAVPKTRVGLVLGTSKYLKGGALNPFYTNRIRAAAELVACGKIEFVLASGDNRLAAYNEPREMWRDLVEAGVPPEKIRLDYAGFRTLDSVVRLKEVFGQRQAIVISQAFHNRRAVAIGRFKGLDLIGYNAAGVGGVDGLKVALRERLARVKMFIDLAVKKQPKFLGDTEEIR